MDWLKASMRVIWFFFFTLSAVLYAERGIILCCSDKYLTTAFTSLAFLRDHLACTLPVEIWYAGDELGKTGKHLLSKCDVILRDLCDHYSNAAEELRGYHSKPLALAATVFDEVILMDADMFFFIDPSTLFDLEPYQKTGAYFFRDRLEMKYCGYGHQPKYSAFGDWSPNYQYKNREALFKKLIPSISDSVPDDWRHYWTEQRPSFRQPIPSEHQDSSCVVIDKRRHREGIKKILQLNTVNRKVLYKQIHGDKETYWLGLEMAKEPFFVNPDPPLRLYGATIDAIGEVLSIEMVHFIHGEMIFASKPPIPLGQSPIFVHSSVPIDIDMDQVPESKKYPLKTEENTQLELLLFYCETLESAMR